MNDNFFYFGCWDRPGHFLYDTSGRCSDRQTPADFPVEYRILDGGLLPPNQPQKQGRLSVWRTNGWAIISFWDRSVDSRGGCNSAFVVRDCDTPSSDLELLQQAFDVFPQVFERFDFDLILPSGERFVPQAVSPA